MKKSLLYCLICILVFSSVSVCYADSNGTMTYSKSQIEGVIEKTAGAECIVKDYKEDPESYVVENTDSTISIPKDSAGAIVFNSKETGSIGLCLPKELVFGRGQLSRSGTVLYQSKAGNASIGVQALSRTDNGLTLNAVRALITIMDSTAPHDYSFKIHMPNGYRMVWDYDYNDGQDFLDDGTIFILDENDEIVKTIDPAWAKDRDGNYIETYYTIEGNILVQHISFDKNTKFPVVADPTEGDTKTVTKYLKKSRVKSIRDNYAGKPASEFCLNIFISSFDGFQDESPYHMFCGRSTSMSASMSYSAVLINQT